MSRFRFSLALLTVFVCWTLTSSVRGSGRDPVKLDVDPQLTFQGVTRVVAVGDVHGDVDALLEVLRLAAVVDGRGRWSGGRTHLVQTGDLLDRGDRGRAVMDLLIRLEAEARKAGGQVHSLIGNHEVMNMLGDLRYVTEADMAAYADQSPLPDPAGIPRGSRGHKVAFSAEGRYGRWLRTRAAVIRIDQTLFLHGGVSPAVTAPTLVQLNRWVRQDLFPGFPAGGAVDPDGPLWFRGYALDPESRWKEGLDRVLARYGAKRMVMGHTPTRGEIRQRFNGKAVFIDTGLSRHYGRNLAALEIRGAQLTALYPDRKVRLTAPGGSTPPVK